LEECWPCPVFAIYTLAFVLQLSEKHGKTSVRVAEEIWWGKLKEVDGSKDLAKDGSIISKLILNK
jgi:hypothetical protein